MGDYQASSKQGWGLRTRGFREKNKDLDRNPPSKQGISAERAYDCAQTHLFSISQ